MVVELIKLVKLSSTKIDISKFNEYPNILDIELDIKGFENVISLNCSYNNILKILNYSNSLKTLNCSYNKITLLEDLPNSIENLFCSGNPLLNLDNLPNSIKILWCCDIYTFSNLDCLPNSVEEINITDSNIQINNIVKSLKKIKKNEIKKDELCKYKKYIKDNNLDIKIYYFSKI